MLCTFSAWVFPELSLTNFNTSADTSLDRLRQLPSTYTEEALEQPGSEFESALGSHREFLLPRIRTRSPTSRLRAAKSSHTPIDARCHIQIFVEKSYMARIHLGKRFKAKQARLKLRTLVRLVDRCLRVPMNHQSILASDLYPA
jgi:hypothetical protein